MFKILTLIGARPQFIKAAAISRAIQNSFADNISEVIVHSGQHFDANMSEVFFEELAIPKPNYTFSLNGEGHALQTAEILAEFSKVLEKEKPDALLVYGDTNTTLAGALAASKLQIPIVHVEAGLRSFNKSMPEEINRILCDHCSSLLICPTQTAITNLVNEGMRIDNQEPCSADHPKIIACGDIMYDNAQYYAQFSTDELLEKHHLENDKFVLVTMHRPGNTDVPERLLSICSSLMQLSESYRIPMVFPMHPRTRKALQMHMTTDELYAFYKHPYIKVINPASYLEMISLEANCKMVITDSGGVQKEAYFFEKPCLILRPETEWVEIVEQGNATLVDADSELLKKQFDSYYYQEALSYPPIFGDAKSAEYICEQILINLS